MRIVVQKVHSATLTSDGFSSSIGEGLLVTVGIGKMDTAGDIKYMAEKIVNLRIFKDDNDKINLSVKDIDGEIMVVSNFTLQANARRGTRPDFSHAMEPNMANMMYLDLIESISALGIRKVAKGNFGHHMHIETILDGPFNLVLESEGKV